MKQTITLIVNWFCIITLIGCTSMRPVAPDEPQEHVKFKDRVVIYEKSGRIIDMKVVAIDEQQITGSLVTDPLTSLTIPFSDIEKMEVESVDGGKTTLAVLGGILLLPFFLLAAMIGVADSVERNSQ